MMTKILAAVALGTVLLSGPACGQEAKRVFEQIEAEWRRESHASISSRFDEKVTIELGRFRGRPGRDQASQWLRDYFGSIEVRDFRIDRIGGFACSYEHVFEADRREQRRSVTIELINIDGDLRIKSIRE